MDIVQWLGRDVTRQNHQANLGQLQPEAGIGQTEQRLGFLALGVQHIQPVFSTHLVLAQVRIHNFSGARLQGLRRCNLGLQGIQLVQGRDRLRDKLPL